ncbi:MAG: hypothetical protein R3Y06_07005 [Faecalibacterium sp.]
MAKQIDRTKITHSTLRSTPLEILERYQLEIGTAAGWNEETQGSYINRLRVVQAFIDKVAPNVSFEDLEFQDYQNALEMFLKKREEDGKRPYAETSVSTYRNILMSLCNYIEWCDVGYIDPFWGSFWKHRVERVSNTKERDPRKKREKEIERLFLPKSLSGSAEIQFAYTLKRQLKEDSGYALGGLLMLYLGLRPGECCAVKYGNIKELKNADQATVLYVFEQLDRKDKLRNTLKTKNAYRILPIPIELKELIDTRKALVSSKTKDIDDCPLVNDAANVNAFGKRKGFTRFMQETLRAIVKKEAVFSSAAYELYQHKNIKEAEPTAYVLRRNFATIMSSVCMMTDDELQYLMGHTIESGTARNDYTDPELLMRIANKMNKRHLLAESYAEPVLLLDKKAVSCRNVAKATLIVEQDAIDAAGDRGVVVDIYNDCPTDILNISIEKIDKTLATEMGDVLQYDMDFRRELPEQVGRISSAEKYHEVISKVLDKLENGGLASDL